jgi:hypothetical protein
MITESEPISSGLDAAALVWPDAAANRTELLRKVLEEGFKVVESRAASELATRLSAIDKLIATSTGLWPSDFDEQRKSEWPE